MISNKKNRRIAVTTGTRSEYGILREVLFEILKNKNLDLYLIVTGMHLSKKFGNTINEIKKDGFTIHATIEMLPKGNTGYHMAQELGCGVKKFSKVFKKSNPDINLILGDRDEMLASALAAYHMNIPNAHISGGDKTGGIDEYTRHAITKISNIHFTITEKSKERVIKMGENPKNVFFTGSPSLDEIFKTKLTSKIELEKKYNLKITGKEIILLQHPITTQISQSGKQICKTLNAIVKTKVNTIAILPNSDAGNKDIIDNLKKFHKKYKTIHLFKSVPRQDFLGLLNNCGVLVGNSSAGMVEATCFAIPVINLGIRQKGRERGTHVFDIPDYSTKKIYKSIMKNIGKKRKHTIIKSTIFGNGNSSKKIVHILSNIKLDEKIIQK